MPEPRALLSRSRLKVTLPRLQILEVFDEDTCATPKEIYRMLNRREPRATLPTIYRVLAELNRAGVLDRYGAGHGPAIFALHRDERPVHLVCRVCGTATGIVDRRLKIILGAMAHARGFAMESADVQVRGICTKCLAHPQ